MKFLISAAFIVGFLFFSGSAAGASFCVVPDVTAAVDRAEAVFSGKIVDVVAVRTDNRSLPTTSSEYIVKFEVEEWWKGTASRELRVLWRPEIFACDYYPVGEIGERYLVYADSPDSDSLRKDRLLEVTIFNRTSLIPSTPQVVSQSNSANGKRKGIGFVSFAPKLNRRDASNDIKTLRGIRDCGCLLPYTLPSCMYSTWTLRQPKPDGLLNSSPTSPCCTCLRRNMTPFSTGLLRGPSNNVPCIAPQSSGPRPKLEPPPT